MQNCKNVIAAVVRMPVRMAMVYAFCAGASRIGRVESVWVPVQNRVVASGAI